MSVGAYPDASQARVSASDLTKDIEPIKLKLQVEWQLNGHAPSKDKGFMEIEMPPPDMNMLKQKFTKAFERTGLFHIVNKEDVGTVTVTLNDVSDVADAIEKGMQLGRSWGDGYITTKEELELTLSIQRGSTTVKSPATRSAYYSVTAKSKLPDDARLRPPGLVLDDVLEQMLIKCLLDLQRNGDLNRLANR